MITPEARARYNANRRVKRPYVKCGPKFRISPEKALDAFGRVKDGEPKGSLCKELGVTYLTLQRAFQRCGLI